MEIILKPREINKFVSKNWQTPWKISKDPKGASESQFHKILSTNLGAPSTESGVPNAKIIISFHIQNFVF